MFRLQSVERLKGDRVNQENKGSSFKNLKKLLKFGEKKRFSVSNLLRTSD